MKFIRICFCKIFNSVKMIKEKNYLPPSTFSSLKHTLAELIIIFKSSLTERIGVTNPGCNSARHSCSIHCHCHGRSADFYSLF